jgi:hypothetical protein
MITPSTLHGSGDSGEDTVESLVKSVERRQQSNDRHRSYNAVFQGGDTLAVCLHLPQESEAICEHWSDPYISTMGVVPFELAHLELQVPDLIVIRSGSLGWPNVLEK